MLIRAFELADEATKKELTNWIEKKDFCPEEKIKAITEIYNRLGIKQVTLDAINKYLKKSREILAQIEVPEERKQVLYEEIDALCDRKK